jgi:uncharacterized protein (TIGR02597 family)
MAAFAAGLGFSTLSSAQSVTTPPVGAVTTTITAGTGSTRTLSALSIPLILLPNLTGVSSGTISSVTTNTITCTSANWSAGELSNTQTPYLVRITSGTGIGRTYTISSSTQNTASVLTLDATESPDLVGAGVVSGDNFSLIPVYTLSTLLDPTDGVLGGVSAATSDNILINKNGTWSTYFYNTGVTPNRWSRVALGSPDASNEVIKSDTVMLYSRLANTGMNITFTGRVPDVKRISTVRVSGLTFLPNFWPVDTTVSDTQIQSIPGWVSNSSSALADKLMLLSGGVWKTYFYDGSNWRQVALGNPIKNSDVVSSTSGILLNRLGSSSTTALYTRNLPYTF